MKKKLFSLAMVVLSLFGFVGSSWAYFTATSTTYSSAKSATFGIAIEEKTQTGNTQLDFPVDGMHDIMPGSTISKIIAVTNTDVMEAWIRVKVEYRIIGADDTSLPAYIEKYGQAVPVMTYTPGEHWVDGGDGYYYYTIPLAPGASTEVFFDEVRFSLLMSNEYQHCTANLTITAQAVQSAYNPKPESGNLSDLPGWPEE